jgi:hypothetical protein
VEDNQSGCSRLATDFAPQWAIEMAEDGGAARIDGFQGAREW